MGHRFTSAVSDCHVGIDVLSEPILWLAWIGQGHVSVERDQRRGLDLDRDAHSEPRHGMVAHPPERLTSIGDVAWHLVALGDVLHPHSVLYLVTFGRGHYADHTSLTATLRQRDSCPLCQCQLLTGSQGFYRPPGSSSSASLR